MKNIRAILCSSLIITLGVCRQNSSYGAQNAIQIQYKLKESTLTLREPVILTFEVKNHSDRSVNIDLGIDKTQFFELSVITPDGHLSQGGRTLREGFHPSGVTTIEQGGTYEQEILLNQWFGFTTPGRYLVTAKLNLGAAQLSKLSATQSQEMRLEVKPRDIDRLTKLCSELAAKAEAAQTVEAAQGPTLALSHVEDPVAVPYLTQVLASHALAYPLAIAGLERVGDDASVEALLSALNDDYGDVAESASKALARIKDRITDPRLRQIIADAIEDSPERTRQLAIRKQISYLEERDPSLQRTAIQNLMQLEGGIRKAQPILESLARDESQPPEVRAAANDALRKLHLP